MGAIKRKCLECGTVYDSSVWEKGDKETGAEKIIKGVGRFLRISHGSFDPINPDIVTGQTGQNIQAIKMVYRCHNCGSMKTLEISGDAEKDV